MQNSGGVAICKNKENLEKMKSSLLASLFHVVSNKDNNFHFGHWPTGSDSWCKFNADKGNKKNTYKPGPGLLNDVIYKIRPIYLELSKQSELVKCLHGKTQNANESFNGMIWDRIPKDMFVLLPSLQFGVYDVVSNFNIGMKASVLTIEKIGFDAGVCTLRDCKKFNVKCISLPNSRITPKNKLGRQLLRVKRTVQKWQNENERG